MNFHRADGLFGPLIVRSYNDVHAHLYDFDIPEHVITVNDWANVTALENFLNNIYLEPSAILINGRGALETFFDATTGNTYQTPRSVFKVAHGKRYRFRLISSGYLYCPMEFSIDGHNLTLIATDGNPIQPIQVQSIIIYAGFNTVN
jgi:FtsP/CotA-like multicopper oxidase with cupredoxin domain